MEFKPFYVRTENITAQQAQNVFDHAVSNGAYAFDSITGTDKTHKYVIRTPYLDVYTFIGVSYIGSTYIHNSIQQFGDEAVELTYEEALAHVSTSSTKPKLHITKTKPTSGQFSATWVCNGIVFSGSFKYRDNGSLVEWDDLLDDWGDDHIDWNEDMEIWYTILK